MVFTLTGLDEPHQVAMQMFLHQLLLEGGEGTSIQQTQAANKFQFPHVLQKGARKQNFVRKQMKRLEGFGKKLLQPEYLGN